MTLPATEPDKFRVERLLAIWGALALIVLSTLATYSNSFNGPFVFDDVATIVKSPSVRQLSSFWPVLFEAGVSAVGRPLVNLSFAMNYAWGGLDVTSFHVVNLVLHILAGLALFGLVRRTLEQSPVCVSLKPHATLVALFCSLIWTLHPLQTESVTYMVQRSESLVGLFYFLTLDCALRARSSHRPTLWAIASFISCLLGVASKEVIVSAPVAVIVYDWAFFGGSMISLLSQRRWLYLSLFSTWIPLMFLVTLGRQDSAGFGYGLSSWDYSLTQFGAIVRYLRLSFWPDALVLDYGASVTRNANEIIPATIIVGLLAVGSVFAIRYQPWLAFLGFVFFAALSPSSSFIPLVTQTIAEHRMYVSLACVVVITVVAIWSASGLIVRRWSTKVGPSSLEWIIPSVLLSVMAVGLGCRTYARNFEYGNAVRLWTTNIQRCPESLRPYIQIAKVYLEREPAKAIESLNRALDGYEIGKKNDHLTNVGEFQVAAIYAIRGAAFANLKDYKTALADLDHALELDSTRANTHYYRGTVLDRMGREEEALASIARAIEIEPTPEERFVRSVIYAKSRQFEKAIADLDQAIEMDDANPDYYQARGFCNLELRQLPDADADFSKAIKLQPNFVKALYGRAMVHSATNRHTSAIDDLSKVITLAPGLIDAYLHRAKNLLSIGQVDLARMDMQVYEQQSGRSDSDLRRRIDAASTVPAVPAPKNQK